MSCWIKSGKYFSQKVNIIRDKTGFLALHPYFSTKVLVRNSTSNISVSSCMWKRLHRSFGSFRFHRLNRFYRLQCSYRAFRFYRSFHFYFEYMYCLEQGIQQKRSFISSIYEVYPQNLHTYSTVWHSLGTTLAHWLYVPRMHIFTYFKKNKLSFFQHVQ